MLTPWFWKSTLERAVKSFAQTLVALLSADGIGLVDAPWTIALSTAGMAALLSMLTSVASERVGEPGSLSAVSTDHGTPAPARA